ncbi:MAG: MaoC family dehydratase [Gammaproteobacteria bacterium]|nr:MaoC family dehydratase [Gammaproteobacteria bacterium]
MLNRDNMQESIGADSGVADWLSIDQQRINDFADCTLDQQFIHVDPDRAAKTPFGGTIAHGFLSLSLLSHFAKSVGCSFENTVMGINYGFDKIRFLAPVKVNSRIRARARLLDVKEKKPGQFLIKQEVSIEIEGEQTPALIAEWLTMAITK